MDPHPTRSPRYQHHLSSSSVSSLNSLAAKTSSEAGSTVSTTSTPRSYSPSPLHHNHNRFSYHSYTHPTNMDSNHSGNNGSTPSLSSHQQQQPPVKPPRAAAGGVYMYSQQQQRQMGSTTSVASTATVGDNGTEGGSTHSTKDPAEDVEQHCLLFPTYATRHSRSGSKDPLDWNIRVRGWAFSKRSNRRKRLVMSMARKLAGVTKDNKVYETLESRFGMFLASNTGGARFSIQCVGLAKTSHMELAGDPSSHDPTVNVLLHELKSPEGAMATAEAVQEKAKLRKSIERDRAAAEAADGNGDDEVRPGLPHRPTSSSSTMSTASSLKNRLSNHVKNAIEAERRDHRIRKEQEEREESKYTPDGTPLSRVTSPEASEDTVSDRISKGAAMFKGAYQRYKPMVMSQSNPSADSLQVPGERKAPGLQQQGSGFFSSSYESGDESVGSGSRTPQQQQSKQDSEAEGATPQSAAATRTNSTDTVASQTMTHYEDLGRGNFPTVQISSPPGGHFNGTLRVSQDDVEELVRQEKLQGGPRHHHSEARFLKLHAHHPEMTEHCHGIVNLIDPCGISIISDIDDTIKETNISAGARIILQNTFLKDMTDVPGMAAVYKSWWKRGGAIHYVSNSPWQLIPALLDFFHSHKFPPGSAHLRLQDSVLKSFYNTTPPGENKRRCIREILMDFPERKFVLIGDSGEIDMEIYTELAVAYPEQIFRIFIRDISTKRLTEMVANMPSPKNRTFASMLPKAPMNAVSAGLSYFTRQTPAAQAPQTPLGDDDSKHQTSTEEDKDADEESIRSRASAGLAVPRPSSPTPSFASASSTAPARPPSPPAPKNPLELWQERVENCQKQLPEGMMSFFEDAKILQECGVVEGMFMHYHGPAKTRKKGSGSGSDSDGSFDSLCDSDSDDSLGDKAEKMLKEGLEGLETFGKKAKKQMDDFTHPQKR